MNRDASPPASYPHGAYAPKAARTALKTEPAARSARERFAGLSQAGFLEAPRESASGHPGLHPSTSTRALEQDPLWVLNEQLRATSPQGHSPVAPEALSHLLAVRNLNRLVLETLEGESTFAVTPWTRPEGGGGVMSVLRGRDIEKSAVNMSLVVGDKYPSIESEYAGKPFTACGVSLICHAYNPHAPIAHMNVRILTVGQGAQAVTWIGGGGDLTPMIHYAEDTEAFHNALRQACEQHPLGDYPRFKAWCDEYFYIPHRGQTRGVGGIFFDYLRIDDPADTQFLNLVGSVFAGVYGSILAKRLDEPFSEAEKEEQLFWRGRYAEFNLVYDRGTRFGLQSGGHLDAIFGSLPPVVKW